MVTMLTVKAKLTISPLAATCAISGAWPTFCTATRSAAASSRRASAANTRCVTSGAAAMPSTSTSAMAA